MDHQRATPPTQQPGNHDVFVGHQLVHSVSVSAMPFQHRRRVVDHHPAPTASLFSSTTPAPSKDPQSGRREPPGLPMLTAETTRPLDPEASRSSLSRGRSRGLTTGGRDVALSHRGRRPT